jgi:hypothetical protein
VWEYVESDWETSIVPIQSIPDESAEDTQNGDTSDDEGTDEIPELGIQQIMVKELEYLTGFIDAFLDIGNPEEQIEDVPDEDS